ncbi:MAG: hypothetical protein ABFR82_04675 [Nitrospirota bacterium]
MKELKENISLTVVHNGGVEPERNSKQLKKEVLNTFQKFGYLLGNSDHEVTLKITSGSIAWISINSIQRIK